MVQSFGFKYGLPLDCDMVFDVRFLPNPYYDPELRPLTGLDAPASQSLGRLLDSLAAEGRLVIASHHDLNTVADIFDTILLMNRDLAAFGPPKEVLTPARIRETYGMEPQPEIQAS